MSEPIKAWIGNKALLTKPDGTVLFIRDSGSATDHAISKGWWDLPGGRMEAEDVDCVQSLRREVQEEIGYWIPDEVEPELFSTQFWRRPDGQFLLLHFYRVPVEQDVRPVLSQEHSEGHWSRVADQIGAFEENDSAFIAALNRYIEQYESL